MESLMTPAEVAAYLNVKPQTLRYWASNDKGPPYLWLEGQRRYDRAQLLAWLEERKVRH